jgi:restriction system protein
MTAPADIPAYHELLWPALLAMDELGGSASIGEMEEAVVQRERFTDGQLSVLHNDGPPTEIGYRLAWARTYLKGIGLLTNSARGVWTVTDAGTALLNDRSIDDRAKREHVHALWAGYQAERRRTDRDRRQRKQVVPRDMEPSEDSDWKTQLLERLMAMPPDRFERLAQRLLREADFDSVNVIGRSGDGGIDVVGVYRLGLVSFPVFVQCKRYRGSVPVGAVRDLRGAMTGRGDKGLLVTTGTFTAEARREATRDGAPPLELIDGERLCVLLKQYELGVRTDIRTVEEVSIEPSFFSDL